MKGKYRARITKILKTRIDYYDLYRSMRLKMSARDEAEQLLEIYASVGVEC